ncbi:hypothetical protein KBB68_00930 [Candidatus Babeliales bacterium]|nr:hypothetical protein [Candidatus Babeliales bacterium]
MKIKINIVFSFLVMQIGMIAAKSDATLIGRFELESQDLVGHSKTFVNNSKYDLTIRWGVKDMQTGQFYRQEPIVKRGDSITIYHEPALKYLGSADKLELSLELLRVRQMPKGAGHPLITTKLKDGSLALALHKTKFLKNDTFAISMNKNGLLVCKSSNSGDRVKAERAAA